MSTKEIIGHIDCPVCGFEMPVKTDKNGHAYGHCARSCNGQVFTRNDHRDSLLRKRMRAVTVTGPEPTPEPVPVPAVTEPAPAPAPKQKSSWLTPVMGGAKHGHA